MVYKEVKDIERAPDLLSHEKYKKIMTYYNRRIKRAEECKKVQEDFIKQLEKEKKDFQKKYANQ